MRTKPSLLLILLWLGLVLRGSAKESVYPLPAAPRDLVTHEEKFRLFAEAVRADVERQLADPARIDDPAALKLLLSRRVHLAHYFADDATEVATAAWIRSLQTDPAEKAFAGLTTFAAVAARQENPGATQAAAGYRAAFAREFARQLASLPATPEIVAMLRRQKEKIEAGTAAALLAEVQDVIEPALARRGSCGPVEADQLVRVHHRLTAILPVRAETLVALDEAIARRSRP